MKLPVPSQPAHFWGESLFKLSQFSEIVNSSADQTIELDLSGSKFLNGHFLAGLFCLIQNWISAGKTIEFAWGPDTVKYFRQVHFPNGFNLVTNPEYASLMVEYGDRTYFPITLFPCPVQAFESSPQMDAAIEAICTVIHTLIKPSTQYREALDFLITELANNVMNHSGIHKGIIFAQAYPAKKVLDIIIADTGKGIFASYKDNPNFQPKDEGEAVSFAMTGCSTKDLPETRGFGLTNSRDIVVKALDSRLMAWSGSTVFFENAVRKGVFAVPRSAVKPPYFQGCFIALRLRIQDTLKVKLMDIVGS